MTATNDSTQEAHPVTSVAQIETLASPVRGEIVDIVELLGPMSVAEIAEALGRPADALYYHVHKIVKAGLLYECDKRKAARQIESVFDVPGRPVFADYEPTWTEYVEVLVRTIGGMLRLAARDFKSAFENGLVRGLRERRNVVHSRVLGWFTYEEVLDMRKQIETVIAGFRSSARHRTKDSQMYALTTILVPLEHKGSRSADRGRTG